MNKCLLRHIQPLLYILLPRNASRLIRAFTILLKGKERDEDFLRKGLDTFIDVLSVILVKEGLSSEDIAEEILHVFQIGLLLIDYWVLLRDEFFSPAIAILLHYRLATTLDDNAAPQRQDLTFEEIKQNLMNRHWPPQRQRCDFIPAPAI
jgi:hypothetical protein